VSESRSKSRGEAIKAGDVEEIIKQQQKKRGDKS